MPCSIPLAEGFQFIRGQSSCTALAVLLAVPDRARKSSPIAASLANRAISAKPFSSAVRLGYRIGMDDVSFVGIPCFDRGYPVVELLAKPDRFTVFLAGRTALGVITGYAESL
jgi:hypothetical protein